MKYIIVLVSFFYCSAVFSQDLKLDLKLPPFNGSKSQSEGTQEKHNHAMHKHEKLDVSHYPEVPAVEIQMHKDLSAGWNLQVVTKNFLFSPESVNQDETPNQGHAHLYIDGNKVTRLYGEWFYIGKLKKGMHSIRVTLNSNDHSELALGGKVIEAKIIIEN
jgi:hypothetical protein